MHKSGFRQRRSPRRAAHGLGIDILMKGDTETAAVDPGDCPFHPAGPAQANPYLLPQHHAQGRFGHQPAGRQVAHLDPMIALLAIDPQVSHDEQTVARDLPRC